MDTWQTIGQGCLSGVGCISDISRNHHSIHILKKKKMLDKLRNSATGERGGKTNPNQKSEGPRVLLSYRKPGQGGSFPEPRAAVSPLFPFTPFCHERMNSELGLEKFRVGSDTA